ncbi:transposase [Vibrio cyclitrophicus]
MNATTSQIEPCKRLMALEGVREVTTTILYANLGDGTQFTNSRQASAFIRLTPKQYSLGGKMTMKGLINLAELGLFARCCTLVIWHTYIDSHSTY